MIRIIVVKNFCSQSASFLPSEHSMQCYQISPQFSANIPGDTFCALLGVSEYWHPEPC